MNSMHLSPEYPILLVDDEPSWLHSLSFTLEYSGNCTNLLKCSDSRELIGLMRSRRVSLVLLDLVMPHIGGEDLLVQLTREFPDIPVIVLSGLNQLETAVRCMKLGAFDYYVKTSEPDRLLTGIRKALDIRALQRENRELSSRLLLRELKSPEIFAAFTTRSPKMEAIFHYLEVIAGSREALLVMGEPGTGKNLVARALHELACPAGAWVELAVTELDERNFVSLLCGEARQPGLFAQARGGVLCLDGIESLPIPLQAHLAQILLEGEYLPAGAAAPSPVEFRLVCTARVDLLQLVEECRFRKDLFVRLSMHQLRLPPLRERLEDLPLLVEEFISAACAETGRRKPPLPRSLVPLLASYPFPGNVSELRSLITAGVRQSPAGRLSLEPFQRHVNQVDVASSGADLGAPPLLLVPGRLPTLAEARDHVIQEALRRANGNQTIAARLLGISQPALSIHLKKNPPSDPSA